MGEIKHTARFAEIERIFGDYFNSHLAPVMRDTQNYLNRKPNGRNGCIFHQYSRYPRFYGGSR